jgi:ATP-dependent helicase/nuclease subunit A
MSILSAIDPTKSVFVSASAGTGKTKLLIDRLMKLMLCKVKHSKILCLAFTKAASVEIIQRINSKLAYFATCSTVELLEELKALGFDQVNEDLEHRARILFAETLDAIEPLKIQTIHSFCNQLLTKFPFEAGLDLNFTLLDENKINNIINQAKSEFFTLQHNPEDISYLAWHIKDYNFNNLLNEIVSNRNKLEKFIDSQQGMLLENIDEDKAVIDFIKDIPFTVEELALLNNGGKNDASRSKELIKFINYSFDIKMLLIEEYLDCFLTKEGEELKSIAGKNIYDKHPELSNSLERERRRSYLFNRLLNHIKTLKLTKSFLSLASQFLKFYKKIKKQNKSLDYDDLINITTDLLDNNEVSEWIRYQLDGGVDHILVDEAQDTSFSQWSIIDKISNDFFDSPSNKSLFIVGDAKQSIFSFQGAKPEIFNNKNYLLPKNVVRLQLNASFRSGPKILNLVDKIFNQPHIKPLVTGIEENIEHINTLNINDNVEIWPLLIQEKNEENYINASSNIDLKLSSMIVNRVKTLLNQGYLAEDIMILTRRRTELINVIIKGLRDEFIPVSGLDRLKLLEHPAILDLISLTKFILCPADDVNLAITLRSTLFRYSEEELFDVCYDRKSTIWESINDKTLLTELAGLAQNNIPFDFFFYILEYKGMRNNFIQEFGSEVNDVIDAFLDFVDKIEAIPSLQLFLDFIENNNLELKRDLSENANQVRVMSVHGSKGLQSKIVFLLDTTSLPHNEDSIIWLDDKQLLWPGRSKYYPEIAKQAKSSKTQADYAEYLRLLYVALTRAKELLVICGNSKKDKISDNCWYSIISSSLKESI